MSDVWFYRPSAELAAALRDYEAQRTRHIETVVRPFVKQYPDNEPLVNSLSNQVIGFKDGKPEDPPPEGLSRSQRREHLIPVRQAAGDPWREWMRKLELPVRREQVFRRFGCDAVMGMSMVHEGRAAMHYPNFVDFGDDEGGMFVYYGTELPTVPESLTPVKRSEFYAIQEAYEERRETQP